MIATAQSTAHRAPSVSGCFPQTDRLSQHSVIRTAALFMNAVIQSARIFHTSAFIVSNIRFLNRRQIVPQPRRFLMRSRSAPCRRAAEPFYAERLSYPLPAAGHRAANQYSRHDDARPIEYPAQMLFSTGSVPACRIFQQCQCSNDVLHNPTHLPHQERRIYQIRLRKTALFPCFHK